MGNLSRIFGQWFKYAIDENLSVSILGQAADIDNDGDLDVAASGFDLNEIYWYENDHLSWTPHLVDRNLIGPVGIQIADINGDDIRYRCAFDDNFCSIDIDIELTDFIPFKFVILIKSSEVRSSSCCSYKL